jgi:hypothetical protein
MQRIELSLSSRRTDVLFVVAVRALAFVFASFLAGHVLAADSARSSDLALLQATVQQLTSIENEYSASEVKFRELMTYSLLTKDLSRREKEQLNGEFRQVFEAITKTLGRSKRVMPIALKNAEASRNLKDAVAAHKAWSDTQRKKYSALLRGDVETAMNIANDDSAATSEAASLLRAYKALGAAPFQ